MVEGDEDVSEDTGMSEDAKPRPAEETGKGSPAFWHAGGTEGRDETAGPELGRSVRSFSKASI